MDIKKKHTKEEIAFARQKLAEARQKIAQHDAAALEEQRNKPYSDKKAKADSFEDIKLRSSSPDAPINKGVKIAMSEIEKLEADPLKIKKGDSDEVDVVKEVEVEVEVEPDKEPKKYEKRKPAEPKSQLLKIADLFLKSEETKHAIPEMEAKFGTRGIRRITKIDYDNVIKKLDSVGFRTQNPGGNYTLKIQAEFLDIKTGTYKISRDFDRFRIEIKGIETIQEYCKSGNIQKLIETKSSNIISIMKKTDVFIDDQPVQSADFNDFNFRVTYKNEEGVSINSKIGKEMLANWDKSKKQFRYINRVTYSNNEFPFVIDLSIVRSSTKDERGQLLKTYNIQESNVFINEESYEIEIEVRHSASKQKYRTAQELVTDMQRLSKYILCGLQKTNFPISYPEQRQVITDYMKMMHVDDEKMQEQPNVRAYPNNFIGPSSKTLQIKNIAKINSDMVVPNITAPYSYCVTDKADGIRHLMFINNRGHIYLIDMQMNVVFTGSKTEESRCFNSIIDGELILHDKNGIFINTFAAFDIYYASTTDVRARPFIEVPHKNPKIFDQSCRLPVLKEFMSILKATSIVTKKAGSEPKGMKDLLAAYKKRDVNKSPMLFITKNFYPSFDSSIMKQKQNKEDEAVSASTVAPNIFEACNFILQRIADNLYEYNTDGLIFTPTLLGVGSNAVLEAAPLKKVRWDYSFKWKPPRFNTIDFLITTKKGADGQDITTPIFENGVNVSQSVQFNQYKTLILQVGFDEKRHGYINPCQELLDEKTPETSKEENEEAYGRKQFYPSDPFNASAGLCSIMLEKDGSGNYQMFTEEREIINDESVVEFRYDLNREGLWKWIPLRVRYDKTTEFKNGKISCNDYDTANDNWYSIHNPITEKMIATGQDIPEEILSDEIYYNRVTSDKQTMGLRDFHNLFVKKILIRNVSRNGNILIDFACGQGGDLPKWISANLSFVFGIDISKNNIENRISGACARYLTFKKDFQNMPNALFVVGNSSLNVRSGKAMSTDKGNAITQAVFGLNALDKSLGPAVKRQYAKAEHGFDVSSCQFSIHYMFENKHTFYNFIRNVAECTREGGYFIGTCYDGKLVFNRLRTKAQGEGETIYHNEKKVWSVTKDYDAVSFEDNISSLGYKISVYQESINQTIPEYLVNFDFLVKSMSDYGFRLLPRDDAKKIGLPEGSGLFIEMYNKMMDDIRKYPNSEKEYGMAPSMMEYEKRISFLNRFFVFQKIATRNVEKLTKSILENAPGEFEFEDKETKKAQKVVEEVEKEIKPKVKKLKNKIKLQDVEIEEGEDVKPVAEEKLVAEVKPIEEVKTKEPVEEKKKKKTKKLEDVIENEPKKKATRKKKVLVGDISEE